MRKKNLNHHDHKELRLIVFNNNQNQSGTSYIPGKVCLTWKIKSDRLVLECKTDDFDFLITFFDPVENEKAYCLPHTCHSYIEAAIFQNITTNETILSIPLGADAEKFNGWWDCRYGSSNGKAMVEITLSKFSFVEKKDIFKMKKKQYEPNALKYAYDAVQNGMSVNKAVISYGIPENTLRGHHTGYNWCWQASGNAVPPYYLFQGVKFDRALLLDGTPTGSGGQCSKTGWSNSDIFKTYLEKHFLKKVEYILFNSKAVDTSELAPASICHTATSDEATEPTLNNSHFSQDDENTFNQPDQRNGPSQELSKSATLTIQQFEVLTSAKKEHDISSDHDESNSQPLLVPLENMHSDIQIYTAEPIIELKTSNNSSNINAVNSSRSGFLLKGNLGKKKNIDHLNQSKNKVKFKPPYKKSEPKAVENVTKQQNKPRKDTKKRALVKRESSTERVKKLKKMKLSEDDVNAGLANAPLSDSDLTVDDDGETCCVCNKKSPSEIRQLEGIVFVKWAQCDNDNCRHRTHLQFCSDVRVLRRGDTLFCPQCKEQ
ncbi:unnamed protein product [Mytilus coruscus]|uniref:HTH psq-type domain-containing protein n=1 Tax=Mytilus coruscus TaxID=42192 RepID=A0A6J8A5A3_MYTCO|nr:unnamed protein product [Mytilus coruscus]